MGRSLASVFGGSTAEELGGVDILTEKDMRELGAGVLRVYDLMKDGHWHSRKEVCIAAGKDGVEYPGGPRRMRQLRDIAGFKVERRRTGVGRNFEYRLVRVYEGPQMGLL
jgi:hypothetical protein